MHDDFPFKNTVCTPYIPVNVWFWPTLQVSVRCESARKWEGCGLGQVSVRLQSACDQERHGLGLVSF